MATASSPAFAAPDAPMATVATGTPRGICTIESSESSPFSAALCTGTPMTGTPVCDATRPGRCAAPPAPAMITSMPRPAAAHAYSAIAVGVRCADTTLHSCGTPKRVSISSASFIVSQSDLLPMMTLTSTAGFDTRLFQHNGHKGHKGHKGHDGHKGSTGFDLSALQN